MWKDIETSEDLLGYRFHAKLLKEIVLDKSIILKESSSSFVEVD